jgi:threonine/homoserine/homoserine lactone efflux protein
LLILVGLRSVLAAVWRVTRDPDAPGSIAASMTNRIIELSVTEPGGTVVQQTIPFMTAALWVAGPPLLLWLAWLAMRPRAGDPRVASPTAR